jgi:hypothetical protein
MTRRRPWHVPLPTLPPPTPAPNRTEVARLVNAALERHAVRVSSS